MGRKVKIKILVSDLDSLIKGLIFVDIWDLSFDIISIKKAELYILF